MQALPVGPVTVCTETVLVHVIISYKYIYIYINTRIIRPLWENNEPSWSPTRLTTQLLGLNSAGATTVTKSPRAVLFHIWVTPATRYQQLSPDPESPESTQEHLRKDPNSAVSQALRMRPQHLQRPAEIQLQHHEIPSELLPPEFQVLLICLFSSPCALASRTSKAGIIEKLGAWCSLCTVSLRHFWTLHSKQSMQRELLNSVVSQSSTWSLSTCQLMHMNWKVIIVIQ